MPIFEPKDLEQRTRLYIFPGGEDNFLEEYKGNVSLKQGQVIDMAMIGEEEIIGRYVVVSGPTGGLSKSSDGTDLLIQDYLLRKETER